MANFCSIIKDAPYQRLRGILGAEEAARVLDRNNSYDLMYSPTGEESPIWRSLITRFNGDEVKTLIATAYFYTDNYLELNDWITVLKEKEYKDRKYEESLLEILSKAPRNAEGKLLAPNGKVSNLTERQYAQVRTELFKNWFGDWENDPTNASKVVDENGEPLVVYHHTNNPNLLEFSIDFDNYFSMQKGGTKSAIFFTTNSNKILDRKITIPVFLNLKTPFRYNGTKESMHDLGITYTQLVNEAESQQGAIFTGLDDNKLLEQTVLIAYNPNQIKSAIHNNGDFSVANDNIEYRIDNAEIPDFSIETTTFNFLRDSLRKAGIDVITDERQIAQELGIDPYDLEGITPFKTPGVLKYSDLEAMHTSKKIYGFSKGNKIYLTKEGMDYNTPIHEYTHLWAKSMMINNPKAWSNIVEQLRSTDEWSKVISDPNYSSISEDENLIASEVLARISGTLGSELIMKETADSINNMAASLKSLWNWVSDLFSIDSFDSIDSITSRILYDLLSGTDLKFKTSVPEIKIDHPIINGSSSPYTSWKWQNLKSYPIEGKMTVPFDPFNPLGKLFENTPLGIEINDAITPDDMITFMFGEDVDGNPILYKLPLSWKATKLLSDLLDIGYTASSIRSIIKSKKDQRLFLSLLANSFFNHGLLDVYDYIDALLKIQYAKFNELKEFKIASYTPSTYDGKVNYKDSKIKVFLTDSNYQYNNQYSDLTTKSKQEIGLIDEAGNGSFGLHGTSFSLPVHAVSGESLSKEEIMNNFLALIATAKLNPNNTFIIIEPDYEGLELSREDLAEIIGSLDTLPNNIQLELSLVDENSILSKPITRNRFSYKRAASEQDKSIEVSSAGDKSYSAQTASLKEGTKVTLIKYNGEEVTVTIGQYSTTTQKGTKKPSTSIENIYQHGFKENIWSGEVSGNKVEKPTENSIAYCGENISKTIVELHSYINYLRLWLEWAKLNPNKIKDLLEKKESILTDKYAKTSVTQARALAEIANNSAIVNKDGKKYLVIFDQVYELGVGTYKITTNLPVLIEAHKQLGNLTYFYKGDKKYYITVTPNKREVLDIKDALGGNVIEDNKVLSDSEITSLGIEKLIIRKSKVIPHVVLENTIDIMMPFNLTQEQEEGVNTITAFMESSGKERIMTLQGFAGTGKSTVMGAVRKFIEAKNDFYTDYGLPFRAPNILWAATTHSAALNLSKALNGLPVITLLSAMGSKPSRRVQNDFEVPEKAFKNTRMPIANCDIIVIDEASMVSAQALEDLRKWMLHNPKLKVLFIGDPAQLPPVNGGGLIPAFEVEAKGVLLTKVMRAGSGNPVIDESMTIRENGTFSGKTTIRNKKGVLFVNNNGFSDGLTNCIQVYADSIKQVGGVPNPYFFKVLAYTNANVSRLNTTVRNLLFELNARIPFLIGDVITAHVNGNGLINAANYVVTKVSDPITTTLVELTSEMPDNDIVLNDTTPIKGYTVTLYNPISKDYTEKFFTAESLPTAVVTAINTIELSILDAWKLSNMVQYYKLQSFLGKLSSTLCAKKSLFDNNSINKFQGAWDYGYASTVHKAQGSTYDHVFIDTSDFNRCTNIDEKHALLYTAITRASQSATILDEKGSSTVDSEVYKNSNTGQVLEDTIPIKLNSNLLALENFLNNQMSNEDPGIIINPYTPKSSLGIADEYKSKQVSRSYHQLTTPMKFGIDVALYLYLKENNLEKEDPKIELLERALLDCNSIAIKYMDQCLAGLQKLQGQLELRGVWFYRTPNGQYAMDNKGHFDIERMVGGLDLSLELFELEQDFNISAFLPVKESKYKPAEIIAPDIHQFNLLRQIGNTTLDDFRHKIQNKVNKLYNSPNVEENKSLGEGIIVRESDKTFSIVFVEDFTNIDSKEYGDVLDDIEIDDEGYRITPKGDRMYKLPIDNPQVLVRRIGKSQEDFYETIFIKVDPTNELSKKDAKLIVEDILRTDDDIVTAQALLTKPTKGNDVIANSGILFASELSKLCANYSTLKEFITPVNAENIEDLRLKLSTQYFDRIDEYIELEAQQLYASFRLALHVVSTRLPSQALASIQDAMVVAFNKSNINNAFVTRWLLWLQGSDLDIDKTFLLNYNTDKYGKLYHWSRIANYRTDRLTDLSMKLPLPSGREIIWNNPGIRSNKVTIAINSMETPTGETPVDLSKDLELYALIDLNPLLVANQLKIAGNPDELEDLCRLTLEIRILNKIGSHNFVYGFHTIKPECAIRLINKLNKHNLTKTSEKAKLNFNTANIRNIISSRVLALQAFETVDLALIPFKEALKKIKGGVLYRPDDGSWIAILDKINSSGKTGVGPCANGLKTYFGNTFVANNFYNDQPTIEEIRESPVFFLKTFELKTVIDGNPLLRERRTFASMTDTMLNTLQLGMLKSLYLELDSTQANLSPLFLSRANLSNLFSGLLTLAVDNAKELALGKLNASLNLICIHVALASLGYNATEIAAITTSPAFYKLVKEASGRFITENGEKLDDGRPTKAMFEKLIANAESEAEEHDFIEIKRLYELGAEITQEALLFGINQGVTGNIKDIEKKKGHLTGALRKRLRWFNTTEIIDENGHISEGCIDQLMQEAGIDTIEYQRFLLDKILKANQLIDNNLIQLLDESGKVADIDAVRFFNDENYKQAIIAIYDIFKAGVNVYYSLDNLQHYSGMFNAFVEGIEHLKAHSDSYRFITDEARKKYNNFLIDNKEYKDDVPERYMSPEEALAEYAGLDLDSFLEMYGESPVSSYDSSSQLKIRFMVPSEYGELLLAAANQLYNQRMFVEFLKNYGSEYEFTYKNPYGSSNKSSYVHVSYNNNKDIINFLNFMREVFTELTDPDNPYANTELANLFTPYETNLIFGDSPLMLYLPYQKLAKIFADDGNASLKSKLLTLLQLLGKEKLRDLYPLLEVDKDITFGDLFNIYANIVDTSMTGGLFELDEFKNQLLVDNTKSAILMLQVRSNFNNGLMKVSIDPHILMAFMVSSQVRKLKKNRIIRFSDGFKEINLDNTLLLLLDEATHDSITMDQTIGLMNAIKLGDGAGIVVNVNEIKLEDDGSLTSRLEPNKPVTFTIEVTLLGKTYRFKLQPRIIEYEIETPNPNNSNKTIKSIQREDKFETVTIENVFPEMVHSMSVLKDSGKSEIILSSSLGDLTRFVTMDEVLQNITTNKGLVSTLHSRAMEGINTSERAIFEGIARNLRALGVDIIVVDEEDLPSEYLGKNIRGANIEGKIVLVAGNASKGTVVHELLHSVFAVLKAKDFKKYKETLRILSKYTLHAMKGELSYYDYVVNHPEYKNMMESDIAEEAFLQLLEDIFTKEVIDRDDLLTVDGTHLFEAIQEVLTDPIQETFGILQVPNIIDFLKTSITKLPNLFPSELWLPEKIASNGYLANKIKIGKMQGILNWIAKKVEEGVINKKC